MSRLIDADHVIGEIENLKESPWFNYENIDGARKIRKEALEIVIALCIKHEPTACDIEQIKAEIKARVFDLPKAPCEREYWFGASDAREIAFAVLDKYTKGDRE